MAPSCGLWRFWNVWPLIQSHHERPQGGHWHGRVSLNRPMQTTQFLLQVGFRRGLSLEPEPHILGLRVHDIARRHGFSSAASQRAARRRTPVHGNSGGFWKVSNSGS
jgi:hypothetical protein